MDIGEAFRSRIEGRIGEAVDISTVGLLVALR